MKARRSPFAMIPLWVYDDPLTTPTVLAVYVALAALAYDRSARRSVSDLVARSGLSKTTVYAALATLERMAAILPDDGHLAWFLPVDPDSALAECPNQDSAQPDRFSALAEKDSALAESDNALPRERSTRGFIDNPSAFDAFWAAYPYKADKAAARRAWEKAAKKAEPGTIVAGASRYALDPNRSAGFTKHPATWLNAGAWDNPPLPSRLPAATVPKGWHGIQAFMESNQ